MNTKSTPPSFVRSIHYDIHTRWLRETRQRHSWSMFSNVLLVAWDCIGARECVCIFVKHFWVVVAVGILVILRFFHRVEKRFPCHTVVWLRYNSTQHTKLLFLLSLFHSHWRALFHKCEYTLHYNYQYDWWECMSWHDVYMYPLAFVCICYMRVFYFIFSSTHCTIYYVVLPLMRIQNGRSPPSC